MALEDHPSADRPINYMCSSKDKGHRCVELRENHHETHRCFCNHKWEEVRT